LFKHGLKCRSRWSAVMSTIIRSPRLWIRVVVVGSMLFAAPAAMAGGIGYTLSWFGPGYSISYSGCSTCRRGGWVSANTGWGWAPYTYGGYSYAAPGYSYYSSYGDDGYYDNGIVIYSSPYIVYRGYRDWRYRAWRRDRDWRYRGWRGDHDYYRDRGWRRDRGYGDYQRGGWSRHNGGYWGQQRNRGDKGHGWRRDRGDSGRWGGNHRGERGHRGDRDGHH